MAWSQTSPPTGSAVTLMLAGPPATIDLWYGVLVNEPRLRVVARAVSVDDLRMKLATNPHVLLLDPLIVQGPNELVALLTGLQVPLVYVVVPASIPESDLNQVKEAISGQGRTIRFYRDTVNLMELTQTILSDAQAAHHAANGNGAWQSVMPSGTTRQVVPVRLVGVWSLAGGVGKTTVASNLAFAAARRGIPTLLVGLGAPDDLPLILGLRPTPNVTTWRANPTQEGLKAAIQKRDIVDVLAGFPDILSAAQAMGTPADAPNAFRNLADQAIRLGYAAIVFDLPPSIQAVAALNAINVLVLVARPSVEGVMRAVEAYRTVVERLGMENLLHPANVRVVLNQTSGRLDPSQWHDLANRYLSQNNKRLQFPPITVSIPRQDEIVQSQDQSAWPYGVSSRLAQAMDTLAMDLFGGQIMADKGNGARRIRIKLPF